MKVRVWYSPARHTVQIGVDVYIAEGTVLSYQGHIQEFNEEWFGEEVALWTLPQHVLVGIVRRMSDLVSETGSRIKRLTRELDGVYEGMEYE